MGSLGSGELLVIAIVALVVFGPKRLPELAKKAGELLAQARSATRTLTDAMDSEYSDISAPLQSLKAEYDLTMNEIKNVGSTVTGMAVTLPGEEVGEEGEEDGGQQTADDSQEEEEEAGSHQPSAISEEEDGRQQTADDSQEEEAGSQQPSAVSEDEGRESDNREPIPGSEEEEDSAGEKSS